MADKITVPETIVVHLGRPESDAQNITVTFPDYIKNVASSEIYPTWPQSALLANIYAIISFALNRIYLRFYRSQGYNFDITSSSSIDQSFVEGRNIFENISNIVDEVFNNYVRVKGRLEPLSTRFCNGTTVTCEGLSQWGTVDLANQNYGALDILKYYYGDDIEIVYDAPVGDLPEAYPGTPLRLGDSGNAVYQIQVLLNRISDNYPAIPKIYPVDGIFDEETEQAVKKFQSIFSLTPDGIVGKQTWYKLEFLYVGIKNLTELTSEGIILNTFPKYPSDMSVSVFSYVAPQSASYGQGDTGDSIRVLQYWLNWVAAYYPSVPAVPLDGVFGPSTENGVLQFQKQFDLPQTGTVDAETWDTLYRVYAGILKEERIDIETIYQNSVKFPMKLGDSGDSVRELQTQLNRLKSRYPMMPTLLVNGNFGQKTRMAVMTFQQANNLPITGVADEITYKRIAEQNLDLLSAISPKPLQYPGYVLKEGMTDVQLFEAGITRGNPIYHLHDGIRQISYAEDSVPSIVPQSNYDENTVRAVKEIQKLAQLPETGETDFATMDYIRDRQ